MATTEAPDGSEGGIAIVGLSLRVTGARNVQEFWSNLVSGVESIRQLSDEELLARGESPERLKHPRYVKSAGVMHEVDMFDPEFFGLSPKEGGIMDPQHRHLLECAWEALEDAGHLPETFDGPIGVWAGCGMGAYFTYNVLSNRELVDSVGTFLLRHTGNDKDFLATRVSYCLNLRGPSVNIQTACSTSLVAAHYACQSLLSGECDMALAGGVTIEVPHNVGYIYEEGEVLSPDGHCRAFDHRSAGTVFGSGAGIVVLRRLEDALRDGDRIYGVIKGSAVNNDGSGKVGYLAPSVEGQSAAIAEALAVSGVDADSIGYVECHGTGTAVGDPIEVAALTEAFRETTDKRAFCRIGSVKTNIGHLDTAAGVASLIKATLALKNRVLPPTINFEKANPHIDFASTPFIVNDKLTDFPPPLVGTRRRATVNSLGVGGTNAHMVVEEATARAAITRPATHAPQLLLLSGRNRGAVDGNTQRLAQHLRDNPDLDLRDVARTLAFSRRGFVDRRALVARDRDHAIALLESNDPRKLFSHTVTANASVVFMFPGGGAQYPDMGRHLYETEPVFREHVDRGLTLLQARVDFDARKLLFPDAADRERAAVELERPSRQLPLLLIIEVGIAQLWIDRGVAPSALIGHSMGENAAAVIAGVMRFDDALELVLLRGRLFDEVPAGGMLSVPLAEDALLAELGSDLDLASVNGPELCVASGPTAALDALQARLAAREIQCQPVRIHIAAHSRMLDGIVQRFGDLLRKIPLSPPRIPIISNRTGRELTASEATSPDYWVQHLRGTVRFSDGVGALLHKPGRVFLEVGPGRALCSLARMHPNVAPGQAFIGSLPHIEDTTPDHEVFVGAFGRLWAAGVEVDLKQVIEREHAQHITLPSYAFQRQRYWIEPQAPRAITGSAAHPERIADQQRWFFAPVWRQHFPEAGPDLTPRTCLVFVDETGLGDALCERLRAAGDDVVAVRGGDTFAKISDAEYRLAPEHGAEGYGELIREVLASGKTPDRIVHLWLLSDGETFRPGSSFFHRNQEVGMFSLLYLAQALTTADLPSGLHIAVITRGMQDVAGNHPQFPEQATVLGPVKVIPRELPGVTCASIDLAPLPARPDVLGPVDRLRSLAGQWLVKAATQTSTWPELDALTLELRLPPERGEVVLAADARWVKRYESIALSQPGVPRLRDGGVYLVTGGLGGIAFALAKSLAEVEHAKLVLLNRTPLPPAEEWDEWLQRRPGEPETTRIRLVRQLEGLGAEVLVCAGDVADLERMREVVVETKQRFGTLHGVIHAAGVVEDAPLAAKRQSSVEAVIGPKVYGTLVLDRVLRDEPLDFFVLFSSTSTAIAAAGQVDYVAANAFLDAYADKARAEGRNVIALGWGVWADVGLAASIATRLGADNSVVQGRGAACAYPLFDTKWVSQTGQAEIRGTLDAAAAWMVDEHRTGDQRAVLPGTGYLEMARAALREVGHDGPFAIEDLFFLRPLDVPDDNAVEFRIRLKPSDEGFAFELHSRRAVDGAEGYLPHAQAFLRRFLPAAGCAPVIAETEDRCDRSVFGDDARGHTVKQERHLRFGARWRVLRRYALGNKEAIAHLALRPEFRDDARTYGLHPGLLDIATGFAIELEPSYRDDRLWVPVSYDRVAVYADLTPELVSVVRLRPRTGPGGFARFDVTLLAPEGRVLVEVKGFAMQALAGTVFETPRVTGRDLERDEPRREASAPERAFLHNLAAGITPAEGVGLFRQVVLSAQRARVLVTPLDLRQLIQQADAISAAPERSTVATFERPDLHSEYVAPRTDVEKWLAGMWEGLLGVSRVGVKDDFFELGGHSLIAVRLFARISKTFAVDLPISALIENPTIEACARLIAPGGEAQADERATSGTTERVARFKHLVPMNQPSGEGRARLPFFLVAGMFGNVMNLRSLAALVGEERPIHGLQAKGLLGTDEPHETFEEMARDYIAELRSVQPHGPYLLGGFSGGGLTAWEMARQLREAGEEVPLVVMLDTPIAKDKPLTRAEKLYIRRQEVAERGPRFALEWVNGKLAYRRTLKERAQQQHTQSAGTLMAEFRSQVVEAAFYRALERYDVAHQPVRLVLFRPRLKPVVVFGPGSAINKDRRRIYVDNGWGPYADQVEVFETPGDHDSMVLEPNVRILAARLRRCLNEAELAVVRGAASAGTLPHADMSNGKTVHAT